MNKGLYNARGTKNQKPIRCERLYYQSEAPIVTEIVC